MDDRPTGEVSTFDPMIELVLGGREVTEPRLSPDATTVVAVVRPSGGRAEVVALPVDGGPERTVVLPAVPAIGRGRNGGCLAWLPDSSGIVVVTVDGDLVVQPLPHGEPRRLGGWAGSAEGPACSPDGRLVAVAVDRAGIWVVDTSGSSPARRVDDAGHDFCLDPLFDHAGRLWWTSWSVPDMHWDHSVLVGPVDVGDPVGAADTPLPVVAGTGQIQQLVPLADGSRITLRDDDGWLNVWIDDRPLIVEEFEHAGPTWGPAQRSVAASPSGEQIAFTRNERGFGRLCVVDRASGDVVEIARGVHGQLDWRGDRLVALRSGARTPTEVVAYDTSTDPARGWARHQLLVGPALGWDGLDLPEPEVHEVVTPRATVPLRRYAAGRGRMIVHVHGGPTDQWQVEFLPRVAHWWSRGFDVVVPDPRGSTGHGRAHQQALRGQWGRADVDDVAAVVDWAHRHGWARPDSTVVMGSSSGGLVVLGLLIDHPGTVAGGIALYPVSDLADLAERSHRFEAHYPLGLVGPTGDPRYDERSPLRRAARIAGPLLLMHGDADPVVPVEHSRSLVAAIRAAAGDRVPGVEYVEFAGEGHGLRDPANRRREFELVGTFLERVVRPPSGGGHEQ
jgi:dipeptidyl aminopeptidase/acylaminoacyl peptidase